MLHSLNSGYDTSENNEHQVVTDKVDSTPLECRLDTVLSKAVTQSSHLNPVMNAHLRSVLKVKLWRMKKQLSNRNKRQREEIFRKWQTSTWELKLEPVEVRSALCEKNARLTCQYQKLAEDKNTLPKELSTIKDDFEHEQETLQARRAMFVLCVRSQGTTKGHVHYFSRVLRKYWSVYCYWIGQAYMTLYHNNVVVVTIMSYWDENMRAITTYKKKIITL